MNIQAAADEIQVRLRDYLRNGLFRLAENVLENTDQLRRRLIDNQAPGLASMFASLAELDFSSDFWKQQFLSSLSRIFTISQAIKNLDNLPPDWQNEILIMSGVSFPQAEVLDQAPVSDLWMSLAVKKSTFNSMTMIKSWYYGRNSRRFACSVEYVVGNHIITSATPGSYYEARFHYFPGIHSMRVICKNSVKYNSPFSPVAFQGLQNVARILRRAFTDNPFMEDIPLIMSGLRLAKKNGKLYLSDSSLYSFPINISINQGVMLMAYTGGCEFSAFVIFHEYYCEVVSVWADNKYYVLQDELD